MPGTISRKKEITHRKIIAIDGLVETELLILSVVPPLDSYGVSRLNMFQLLSILIQYKIIE